MDWKCDQDGGEKGYIQNFVGRPLVKCSPGRPTTRWEDNIKM
jgi:hypothetical protein